jgi:hypothetical protein
MAVLKTKKGTKLTEAAVDELAKEAEAGYDLSKGQSRRIGPGRPSLSEGESPRISYRVAPALFDRAKEKAKAEGRTVSEVAREALQRYLTS